MNIRLALVMAAALMLTGTASAVAAPVAYRCEGSRTVYNDGRSQAQWYSSRMDWRGRLTVDRSARTWSLAEVQGVDEPFPESNMRRAGGAPGAGSGNAARGVLEARGPTELLRLSPQEGFPGEQMGVFNPSGLRLTLTDRGREGVVARCAGRP